MSTDERRSDVFPLNEQNPAPFKKPLLVIHFKGGEMWYIEVAGQIDNYLNRYTAVKEAFMALSEEEKENKGLPQMPCNIFGDQSDWRSQASPIMQSMLDRLKELGWVANRVYGYDGSCEPSHVLMNGALFERMCVTNLADNPPEELKGSYDPDVAQHIPALLGS